MMRISFDVDGTYSDYQDEFDSLALMLQQSGHEVGFLSGRSEDNPAGDEFELGFVPDFEYYLGLDDDLTKQEKCLEKATKMTEEDIDLHFDDQEPFPNYVNVIHIEPDNG